MRNVVGAAVALLLAGGLLWRWVNRPTDEKRIRKQLTRLAERVSVEEGESTTTMAVKINGLTDLFQPQFTVDLIQFPANGTYSASEISSHVARIRPMFAELRLTFHDIVITATGEDSAEAAFTARLQVRQRNGEEGSETREIAADLVRGEDGTWRFESFTEHEILQR